MAATVILERFIGHALDHIGRLREEFIPRAIRVDLRKKPRSDRILLFFGSSFAAA